MSGIWMVGLAVGIILMLVAYKGLVGAIPSAGELQERLARNPQ